MHGAGREIHEERLVGRERLDRPHPLDRLVGHVRHEMIVGIVRRLDLDRAIIDQRRPLVGFAAEEAVELVEARMGGPSIERPDRADLPRRRLVIFAERRRPVAVQTQRLGQWRDRVRPDAGVAGKRRRDLGDAAHVVHVMVAAGQQRGARGRAQRRGVELIVAQPIVGQPLQGGHVDRAAESARLTETHIVEQHDQHVRSVGRGFDLEPTWRDDVARIQNVDRRRFRLRYRQDGALHGRRRSSTAGGLRGLRRSGTAKPRTAQDGCQCRFRARDEQVAPVHLHSSLEQPGGAQRSALAGRNMRCRLLGGQGMGNELVSAPNL